MTTFTPTRGSERRSGPQRRTVYLVQRAVGQRDRRSGEQRRRGTDRRRDNIAEDLDERWDQLVEAVRVEFWRSQDPDAVFEPRRDELQLRARVDRPGQDAEWLVVTLTSGQVLNADLATYATEFVARVYGGQPRVR